MSTSPWRAMAASFLLALAMSAVQAAAEDAAPGRLLTVADATLHVVCTGNGVPAAVFEAGIGGNYLDWSVVQAAEGKRRLACSYDRAGAGWSSRSNRPRDAATLAEDLHLAMKAAGVPAPFILVGHSFGGLLAQNYAGLYPADVAGLVFVDSMHPDQSTRFSAAGVDLPTDPHAVLGHTPAIAATYGLPEAQWPLAMRLASADKARIFVMREMNGMAGVADAVRRSTPPVRPTRVLVHGLRIWDDRYPDGRMEAAWRAMQDDLAMRFHAPPVTLVAGSGHQIALDDPAAVASAIEAVAGEIANQR